MATKSDHELKHGALVARRNQLLELVNQENNRLKQSWCQTQFERNRFRGLVRFAIVYLHRVGAQEIAARQPASNVGSTM